MVVSPADGRIFKIDKNIFSREIPGIDEKSKNVAFPELRGLIKEDSVLIIIYMNMFNKHVTLSPIKGKVVMTNHVSGGFHKSFTEDAYRENEHNTILIDGDINVSVIQIAGFVLRRIKSNVKEGDYLNRGDILGRIVFGSAVAIILPKECTIYVAEGDKVKVGETIIATY